MINNSDKINYVIENVFSCPCLDICGYNYAFLPGNSGGIKYNNNNKKKGKKIDSVLELMEEICIVEKNIN